MLTFFSIVWVVAVVVATFWPPYLLIFIPWPKKGENGSMSRILWEVALYIRLCIFVTAIVVYGYDKGATYVPSAYFVAILTLAAAYLTVAHSIRIAILRYGCPLTSLAMALFLWMAIVIITVLLALESAWIAMGFGIGLCCCDLVFLFACLWWWAATPVQQSYHKIEIR